MGEINLQRGNRNEAVGDRVEVGTCAGGGGFAGGTDPINSLVAWCHLRYCLFGLVAAAESCHSKPAHLRFIRHIDVEQNRLPELLALKALNQFAGNTRRHGEMTALLAGQRDGDGRHTQQVALHRRGDRAGVDGVVAHVGAHIDA